MELLTPELYLPLMLVAALAGLVDAISGGGGLLTVPALLWAGVPPLNALATNKLQGSFGTFAASIQFLRKGQVQFRPMLPAILFTLVGAMAGTWSVSRVSNDWLTTIIPVLLIGFALYFLFAGRFLRIHLKRRLSIPAFGMSVGLLVGFYDGFFGPGAGAFYVTGFVLLLGWNLPSATGATKLLNLTSNLAALGVFALSGKVLWLPGLLLGLAQMSGAWVGAHLAIRHGDRIIRPLLVTVSLLAAIKLLFERYQGITSGPPFAL